MPTVSTQKSGKNKKYGRNKKRPSAVRYLAEHREAKNKAKRALRHTKLLLDHANKPHRVPRGTQRRKNRIADGITE
jgi:hypothetical protein